MRLEKGECFTNLHRRCFLHDQSLHRFKSKKCLHFGLPNLFYLPIQVFFPNMVHITCLAHGLHRICETIRAIFPGVDKLVAKTKAVFVKAPYRVKTFREMQPDIPLPPKPVLTRWGTWLDACRYYYEHFDSVREVFFNFSIVIVNLF